MTTATKANSLTYDKLLDIHRKHKVCYKWATERTIKSKLAISSGELDAFHNNYGLPRLKGDDRRGLLYSLPGLEHILETVTELHDRPADYTTS